jgi:ubiquitin-conjugating enzyme (huntingtin interacting protein 2)
MATSREKRITKELANIASDTDHSGVRAWPDGQNNLTHLKGSFIAPPETPYAGGVYHIKIEVPDGYPFKPPTMSFITKIWHPNISSVTGAICLDTLSSGWTPVQTIKSLLMSLCMLLENPNAKDPQDAEVAKLMLSDPEQFARQAHEWAVKYAGAPWHPTQSWPAYQNVAVAPKKPNGPTQYRGYNKNLIERFVNMGFEAENVLDAFEFVGIDRCGGMDYDMEEAYMGDITARLLGEH